MFDVEVPAVTPAFVAVRAAEAQPLAISINNIGLMTTEKL